MINRYLEASPQRLAYCLHTRRSAPFSFIAQIIYCYIIYLHRLDTMFSWKRHQSTSACDFEPDGRLQVGVSQRQGYTYSTSPHWNIDSCMSVVWTASLKPTSLCENQSADSLEPVRLALSLSLLIDFPVW